MNMKCYFTSLLLNQSIAPHVWHFGIKATENKIEKLQHKALRITFGFTSTYNNLLHKASTPILHMLHFSSLIRDLAIETFKCLCCI